jgi:hypothetical protein
MTDSRTGRNRLSALVSAIVSILLYHLASFLNFFLVPLQSLYVRKGVRIAVAASVLTFVGINAWQFRFVLTGVERLEPLSVLVPAALPIAPLAGLFVMNVPLPRPVRATYRLLAATALMGAVSIPIILYFAGEPVFLQLLEAQISAVRELFMTGAGLQSDASLLLSTLDTGTLMRLFTELFFRTYLFGYFLVLGANWRLGTLLGGGPIRYMLNGDPLPAYRLPDRMVWALLVPWAVNLVSLKVELGVLSYLCWNVGLIVLFLYGLQGLGIVKFILARRNVSRGVRFMLGFTAVLLVMLPGVNLVLLLGIPLVGVSELWITYRKT